MNFYNPYYYAMPTNYIQPNIGLLGRLFGKSSISITNFINGTQKVLNIANQTIPLVKQVKPVIGNAKTMFKVMNEFKKTEKSNIEDNQISKKIALLFNITENMVHKYKKMGQSNVVPTEIITKEGEEYSVFENEETFLKENQNLIEKELFIKQRTEQIHLILARLEEFYKKKCDPKISEILTVTVLKEFESERQVFIEDQNLEKFYSYWVNDLIKYNFIDKNILISFFQDPEYILPTQKMIENKYGLKEKYAGKILQRIRESLSKTEIVKEFRNTWLEN